MQEPAAMDALFRRSSYGSLCLKKACMWRSWSVPG